jgi:hypothetical protein
MDKIEIARRNLGVATKMFLRDEEPVAIQTLGATAAEVLDELAKISDLRPFLSLLLDLNPSESVASLKAARNSVWNAIKHVRDREQQLRDDEALMADFSDSANDWILMTAWFDYAEITGAMPLEAQALQVWVIAKDPSEHAFEFAPIGFDKLAYMDRRRQKEHLKRTITRVRKRAKYVNDPRTEARPLA